MAPGPRPGGLLLVTRVCLEGDIAPAPRPRGSAGYTCLSRGDMPSAPRPGGLPLVTRVCLGGTWRPALARVGCSARTPPHMLLYTLDGHPSGRPSVGYFLTATPVLAVGAFFTGRLTVLVAGAFDAGAALTLALFFVGGVFVGAVLAAATPAGRTAPGLPVGTSRVIALAYAMPPVRNTSSRSA